MACTNNKEITERILIISVASSGVGEVTIKIKCDSLSKVMVFYQVDNCNQGY